MLPAAVSSIDVKVELPRKVPVEEPMSGGALQSMQVSPCVSPSGYSITSNDVPTNNSGLGLSSSAEGVSVVHRGQKTLLLGNAKNALAAISNQIPGWDVTHIVCVASRRNADVLRANASGAMIRFVVTFDLSATLFA